MRRLSLYPKSLSIHSSTYGLTLICTFPSITTYDCKHLVIDAGHIAIESDLVDKATLHAIEEKKSKKYEKEDYKLLGSAMYDKMFFKLQDAQVHRSLSLNRSQLIQKDTVFNRQQSAVVQRCPCFAGAQSSPHT